VSEKKPIVAVTGLNATDNPGPGVSVIRSIRHDPTFEGRIVGLAYDALEPGIYARDVVDDVFLLPYPSEGVEALKERLLRINERVALDVVIPTLDAELPSFIAAEGALAEAGIHTFLPTREQFDLRSKVHLQAMGARAGIPVPQQRTLSDVSDLYALHQELPYPLYVKGLYYGAALARSVDEAVAAFHRVVASWGMPVIVQQAIDGDEFDVVAVGDGRGGLVGAVPMKKTYLTDKGKGWAGITVKDPRLHELAQQFAAATDWQGPCELEIMKDRDGEYYLLEVNPRFPAWVYLSAGAGLNLPAATVKLALGKPFASTDDYRAGTMFTRISIDLIADLSDFQQLTELGELVRTGEKR
jgi:carbamoyl-phosphate synthase large subunit